MATASEVLAAEALHQAAQARLGFAAAFLALAEWENVSALKAESSSDSWLTRSLLAIVAIRKMSRRLAVAHYQLVRALETGRTLGVPVDAPESVKDTTLTDLRKTFRDAALDIAALPSPRTRSEDPDIRWFEEALAEIPPDAVPTAIQLDDIEVDPLIQDFLDSEGPRGNDPVPVDRYEWPEDLTAEEVDDAYRDLLRKQAVAAVADKVKALRSSPETTPDEALNKIEEAHSIAGSVGSGFVDFAGIDAGRAAVRGAVNADRLVRAVARGTGSDPCGFCSMLASRGFVFRNENTAGVGDDELIVKYHVHCHCYPIVRFILASELPPLSQYFKDQWPIVTEGYSGKDARNAWRRWIYAQRKANPGAPHGAPSEQ